MTTLQAWKDAVEQDAWDFCAWNRVVDDAGAISTANDTSQIETARSILAAATRVFPTCVRFWLVYIELEQRLKQWQLVEQLFQDVLLSLPDLRLWRLYLAHTRRSKHGAPDEHVSVQKAFEFSLVHIGDDPHAHILWREFVDFIVSVPVTAADEVAGKNALLSDIYQRALQQPIQELDWFWAAYSQHELTINKTLGQALLQEYKPKYQANKELAARRIHVWQGVHDHVCHAQWLPRPIHSALSPIEQSYHKAWCAALAHELPAPAGEDCDDAQNLRAVLAYKQALLSLRHLPDIWYDYVALIQRLSQPSGGGGGGDGDGDALTASSSSSERLPAASLREIRAVWRDCARAMPYTPLPICMAAEWEELGGRPQKASHLLKARLRLLSGEKEEEEEEEEEEEAKLAPRGGYGSAEEEEEEDEEKEVAHTLTLAVRGKHVLSVSLLLDPHQGKLDSVLCVQLMRLLRRTEGMDAARESLIHLRKKLNTVPVQVYAFAASHLYDTDPDKARAILEFAWKKFPLNPSLVQPLVRLTSTTDAVFALATLRQVANSPPEPLEPHLLTPIEPILSVAWRGDGALHQASWTTYIDAIQNGLVSLQDLFASERECARALSVTGGHPIARVIDRSTYLDLVPCSLAYRRMWCHHITVGATTTTTPPTTANPTSSFSSSSSSPTANPSITDSSSDSNNNNNNKFTPGPYLERFLARLPPTSYFGGPCLPPDVLLQFLVPSRKRVRA